MTSIIPGAVKHIKGSVCLTSTEPRSSTTQTDHPTMAGATIY